MRFVANTYVDRHRQVDCPSYLPDGPALPLQDCLLNLSDGPALLNKDAEGGQASPRLLEL